MVGSLSDVLVLYVMYEQGRIHVWPSCERVGRGSDEIGQPIIWAWTMIEKPLVHIEKAKCDRLKDQLTDRHSGLWSSVHAN